MGGHWIVQEGFLLVKSESQSASHDALAKVLHRSTFVERYFVLYMNRKMEIFESNDKETRVDACYVRAFCGWDGEGLLKAGEAYGLELKLDKNASSRMFVAAFNRLDLEKWCRGFVAALDPESAAGQEVRRERRKLRKEEKRAQEEKDEKIRQWKEQQKKMFDDEKRRLQEREEEILNMTPLERIDGLGSLDDDTARMLEKRRQRLQRRQAPTTRRVNKAAYRQRMEDAAGGKLENVQPLQAMVVENRSKVRIEAPAPGHFIEAAGTTGRRHSNPARRRHSNSLDGGSGSDNSSLSVDSRMSSDPRSNGSVSGYIPPPPPPPPATGPAGLRPPFANDFDDSRSDFTPPPPPLHANGSRRESRSHSVRGYNMDDDDEDDRGSVYSVARSSRRLSGVDRDKQNVQANLAAILGGRKPLAAAAPRMGRDSFDSTVDSTTNGDGSFASAKPKTMKKKTTAADSPMANPFAASLAAIRLNRAASVQDDGSNGSGAAAPVARVRDRKRDSQLSAEGKAMLQKAIALDEPTTTTKKKAPATSNGGRKGLFDDSSSDDSDNSDSGLFGVKKQAASGKPSSKASTERPSMARRPKKQEHYSNSDDSDDDDDANGAFMMQRSPPADLTSPRSTASSAAAAAAPGRPTSSVVDVIYKSCVLENQGKKAVAVYTFAFRNVQGGSEHSFSHSYQQLEEIHQRLAAEKIARFPKFPSKHLLRNNNKPENMQKRAMEFVVYFQQLVALPEVFDNKRFLFELEISDSFVQSVKGEVHAAATPTKRAARTPKPTTATTTTRKPTNGGVSRATALFGADDTDSDAESDAIGSTTPKKPVAVIPTPRQPAPETEPTRSKKPKPSRTNMDADADEAIPSSRRDQTRSRKNGVNAGMAEKEQTTSSSNEPAAIPKITGLPARPNLFGGGRGDLLAAIRQGAQLKKADEPSTSVSASASAPLSIGRGVNNPKKPSAAPPPPPPPPPPVASVGSVAEAITNAMANRRIHVEYEDKSDDSDDDWD